MIGQDHCLWAMSSDHKDASWHPCDPLLLTFRGSKYYLGSAVFIFKDGFQIMRTIYKGSPHESYRDVLEKVKLLLPKEAPKRI